jgi:hypothetical protein
MSDQHCLLAETELHKIKDDSKIKRQKNLDRRSPRPNPIIFHLPDPSSFLLLTTFKGSDQWKIRGIEKLANVRRWYQTVAISVCLLFYLVVVFSLTYFRFLFAKTS